MRFRLMATYRGVPYEVGVGPSSSDVVLFAACPPPEELGFEPAPGHWRKQVIRAEVDVLWESRPVGSFHGDPCLVLDDLGDRLHIAYLGKDGRRARELGFWQVDRGVYELLTPREEVTGLNEEKVEKNLPRRGPVNGVPAAAVLSLRLASVAAGARRLRWPPGPARAGRRAGLPRRAGHDPGRRLERQRPSARDRELERQRDQPRRDGRLECPRLPRRHRGLEPATRHPWTLSTRSGWNRDGSPADTGGWSPGGGPGTAARTNGHGMASWNGMAGPDGMLAAPAPPVPGRRRQVPATGRRSARKQRIPTRAIFSELADLAAIPRSAYALEQESDGAMCLLRTDEGFEVFSAADGARHEVRSFDDEEAAYFYLFGVLAAEAVRNGSLTPPR